MFFDDSLHRIKFQFPVFQNTSTKYALQFMVVQNSNTQNRTQMPICYLEEKLN